jgi:hypothetical protein
VAQSTNYYSETLTGVSSELMACADSRAEAAENAQHDPHEP